MARAGRSWSVQNGGVIDPATDRPGNAPALDDGPDVTVHRPATDFGSPGALSHFRGPFAHGPPASALDVDTPPLDRFGVAELRRMVVIYVTITVCLLKALAGKLTRSRNGSWASVASGGTVDAFEALGPPS